MAATTPAQQFSKSLPRNWPRAIRAMAKLLKNKEDTVQVFEIMQALTGNSTAMSYDRMLSTLEGGRIAFERQEIAPVLSDYQMLRSLPEGSLGRAYLSFVESEQISAQGLIDDSRKVISGPIDLPHPIAWHGRRLRDIHDVWHVLTGYGRDALGEACLVAFSYAQTKSFGFAFIAIVGAFKIGAELPGLGIRRAIWQAYLDGRRAAWLPAVDYPAVLGEDLDALRARLNIPRPERYLAVPDSLRYGALKMAAPQPVAA